MHCKCGQHSHLQHEEGGLQAGERGQVAAEASRDRRARQRVLHDQVARDQPAMGRPTEAQPTLP